VEEEAGVGFVWVDVYVVDSACVECACSADDAVDFVVFGEEVFG